MRQVLQAIFVDVDLAKYVNRVLPLYAVFQKAYSLVIEMQEGYAIMAYPFET